MGVGAQGKGGGRGFLLGLRRFGVEAIHLPPLRWFYFSISGDCGWRTSKSLGSWAVHPMKGGSAQRPWGDGPARRPAPSRSAESQVLQTPRAL